MGSKHHPRGKSNQQKGPAKSGSFTVQQTVQQQTYKGPFPPALL